MSDHVWDHDPVRGSRASRAQRIKLRALEEARDDHKSNNIQLGVAIACEVINIIFLVTISVIAALTAGRVDFGPSIAFAWVFLGGMGTMGLVFWIVDIHERRRRTKRAVRYATHEWEDATLEEFER